MSEEEMIQNVWKRTRTELLELREEVKRLRARIEQAITTLRSQPNDLEDGPDYHRELLSFLDGAICHALDILEGKE